MKQPTLQYIPCNICGSDSYTIIYEGDKTIPDYQGFGAATDVMGNDQIVQCDACGLVYINPRLDPEFILEGYSNMKDERYPLEAKGRITTFQKSMKRIEKLHPGPGRLLDIGAAAGFFVKVAHDAGWDAHGVEPNKHLARWAKEELGVSVSQGELLSARLPFDQFDVITFWDVLEHVADPRAHLVKANELLKDGGILIVNYPDWDSWVAQAFKKKWWFILSTHLFYFTPKTIRRILEDTGFEIMEISPHFQLLRYKYLVERLGAYNRIAAKLAGFVGQVTTLNKRNVPYWAGQTLVIAKKIGGDAVMKQEEKDW